MRHSHWQNTGIDYIGTATSHFQSEPFVRFSRTHSDWEYELNKKLNGEPSGISVEVDKETLPQLLPNKDKYLGRSRELGLNMYRFSFDLARLTQNGKGFDSELMADYVRLLAQARMTGHEPFVTLQHFTLPLDYTMRDANNTIVCGGWEHPEIAKHFSYAIRKVVGFLRSADALRWALKDFDTSVTDRFIGEGLVRYFMPFNEPMAALSNSYLGGNFPPYKKGRVDILYRAMMKIGKVYPMMYDELRSLGNVLPPDWQPRIGNGYDWQYFTGFGSTLLHKLVNLWYTNMLEWSRESDFIGLHYYCRSPLSLKRHHPGDRGHGDFDVFGPINPAGVKVMLKEIHESYPNKPIFVSEIGFSDAHDLRRPYWLFETMEYIVKAASEGIPVKGVLYWSLANNFEWQRGMTQKFGLFSEAELKQPLDTFSGRIRSWEVWKAVAEHMLRASNSTYHDLLAVRERADTQFHRVNGH